jgi:hypothetical protein
VRRPVQGGGGCRLLRPRPLRKACASGTGRTHSRCRRHARLGLRPAPAPAPPSANPAEPSAARVCSIQVCALHDDSHCMVNQQPACGVATGNGGVAVHGTRGQRSHGHSRQCHCSSVTARMTAGRRPLRSPLSAPPPRARRPRGQGRQWQWQAAASGSGCVARALTS